MKSRIIITRELAQTIGRDVANQQMRKAKRKMWNRADYDLAWEIFNRLWSIGSINKDLLKADLNWLEAGLPVSQQ